MQIWLVRSLPTCTPEEARDILRHTIDGMIQEGELT